MSPEPKPSAPMRSRRWRTVRLSEQQSAAVAGFRADLIDWLDWVDSVAGPECRPPKHRARVAERARRLLRTRKPKRASLRRGPLRRPPSPASVARALVLVEHATQTAVAICEAIDAGRSPLPVELGAWAEHLRMVTAVPRTPPAWRRILPPAPGAPPTLVSVTSDGRGCWTFELPAAQIRPPPRDPNHKPHPPTSDLHLLRGGTWTPNPWRP